MQLHSPCPPFRPAWPTRGHVEQEYTEVWIHGKMKKLNATHNPTRKSWLSAANLEATDFPIQNLPFGIFSASGRDRHAGVAIGDMILDLTVLEATGALDCGVNAPVFDQGVLNPFLALPQQIWSETRARVAQMMDETGGTRDVPLVLQADATMHLPIFVRAFTDFYASREHATNVGSMFRDPQNALLPNWLHMPIGYNGRASTVVVSGTDIHRPKGQLKSPEQGAPVFAPCAKLDFELEIGAIVGSPNHMGHQVSTGEAFRSIFGYVLLNDWSARDIQTWEYQPLGPFQSKAFGTSISPWIVTREALEPFRTDPPERLKPLLPYLEEDEPNAFDIELKVALTPRDGNPTTLCRTNYRHMYYTSAQQFAHHTSSGCAMETGDLLGSGTISGPTNDSLGSLLELTWNGARPVAISGGQRGFLEDGDTVTMRGHCSGSYRIGFGNCTGTVIPAN